MTKDEWKTVALGDLVEPVRTWNPTRSPSDQVFDYIDLSAVDQDAKVITEAREVSCGEAPSRARQLVARGDVLVSTVRPNLNGVARVPNQLDGATASTGFCVLRARESKFDGGYLFHWVKSPAFVADMVSKATGASYPAVSDRIIFDSRIPLPPLAEQRRIAEVLDRAEALRAKRRAALAQLDSLTQSLFLDLFGDTRKERTRWPTVPLEEIVRETKLGLVRGSQEFGPEFPIPYVRMNAITRNGELELGNVQRTNATEAEIDAYRLEPGDFLFNTRNSEELVGKTALYRGGGLHVFNNNLMRVRFTAKADPIFVAAAFKTAFVQHELNLRKSGTTNVFAIYYKDLRSLPLPLPPIPLQREFARRVTAVEALKTAQRASLAELDALFATLQHRAFKGEL